MSGNWLTGWVCAVLYLVAWGAQARPQIPEPMVFDLVRPLGARRGELEANVLAVRPLRGPAHLHWAPEIEYAFADGHAIEFELPMVGTTLESLKLALQGSYEVGGGSRFIHGWQVIGEYLPAGRKEATGLYLAGLRFDDRWSAFTMVGGRYDWRHDRGELLVNTSVFSNVTSTLVLGLETNVAAGRDGRTDWLAMPQLHWPIGSSLNLQAGAGLERTAEWRGPVGGFRLVAELH